MAADIGIDLGTSSVLIYIKGRGVVLNEPTVVALDRDTNEVKAIGDDADLMIGRTPGNLVAVNPLRKVFLHQAQGYSLCAQRCHRGGEEGG